MRTLFKILPISMAFLAGAVLTGCNDDQNAQQGAAQRLMPVKFVPVSTSDVTVELTLTGRTSAMREAEVRPQVSGIILKRLFTEGSEVKQGQQLYQIDPSTCVSPVHFFY